MPRVSDVLGMWQLLGVMVMLMLAWTVQAKPLPPAPRPPEGPRNMVFVSDLHMGVGYDPKASKRWYPTEDFRWHDEFADFLEEINAWGEGKTDLILVGDILELWQSIENDCEHDDLSKDLGCTEQEAIRRAQRVVGQHSAVFSALSKFAEPEGNRVTLLPGNHDVALAYEGVRRVVLSAFPKLHSGRIRIASEGYWMSADGKVVAEHGQQIGSDPNKFKGWPKAPFRERNGIRYLQQPWGETFVQRIFNRIEYKYSTIDNLSAEAVGVKYVSADQGVLGTLFQLGELLHFLLFQTSFEQARQLLGENGVPIWNLPELRTGLRSSEDRWAFLIESLPKDDPMRAALAKKIGELHTLAAFDDDELKSICDRRWAVARIDNDAGVSQCPDTGKLGAIHERIGNVVNPRTRNKRFRAYLTELRESLPENARPTKDFAFYVYGHTHKEEVNYKPFGTLEGWAPTVFNDGAWQRTANEKIFCSILKSKKTPTGDVLQTIQPEDLPPCYPFVSASYQYGKLSMGLFYWVQKPGQEGKIRAACTELPEIHPECR